MPFLDRADKAQHTGGAVAANLASLRGPAAATWRRRSFLGGAAALLSGAAAAAAPAWAPARPIDILVSFPAGGTADTLARLVADRLARSHNWPAVVVNRPGGGGIILQNSLKAAKADGHTVGFGASYELTYPIGDRVQVDRLRDFDALCSIAALPVCIMARSGAGLDTVEDWRRKAASGKALTFGVSPPFEWIGERMARLLKMDIIAVPFRGSSEISQQLLGGTLDLALSAGSHVPLERAQRAKVVCAVTKNRLPSHPDVPTLRELGADLVIQSSFLLFASKELAPGLRAALTGMFAQIAQEPPLQEALRERGLIPEALTGAALARALQEEVEIGRTITRG
ncbi:tripartite tricarboxylate transporter substrate binding protein [Pseudorhodoferax sp.]|uniref:tripartite tricarboxylate transporter substrate binding protein n=1 Tax=Pseudorhodoferax sp. TaxID=1993553 RepID=UPI002DD6A981|nr:tripartite tricarboxylate transporter substrate binding protein [Pseudorhodoferax sp.]